MRFFRSRIYLGLYDIVATRYRPFLFEGNRNGKIRRRKSANLASGITTVNFHYIYNGRWVSAVKWSRGLCYLLSTIKKKKNNNNIRWKFYARKFYFSNIFLLLERKWNNIFFRFAYVLYRFYKISKKSKDFISISNYNVDEFFIF